MSGSWVILLLLLVSPAQLFFSVENLLNQAYSVGRTPIERLGTPRLLHGGLRLRLGH